MSGYVQCWCDRYMEVSPCWFECARKKKPQRSTRLWASSMNSFPMVPPSISTWLLQRLEYNALPQRPKFQALHILNVCFFKILYLNLERKSQKICVLAWKKRGRGKMKKCAGIWAWNWRRKKNQKNRKREATHRPLPLVSGLFPFGFWFIFETAPRRPNWDRNPDPNLKAFNKFPPPQKNWHATDNRIKRGEMH